MIRNAKQLETQRIKPHLRRGWPQEEEIPEFAVPTTAVP
jgi:hypothetical protein